MQNNSKQNKNLLLKYWNQRLDSLTSFYFIQDREFHIIKVNKALADHLGMTPEELEGRYCYEIVHGTDSPPPDRREEKKREQAHGACSREGGARLVLAVLSGALRGHQQVQ